MFTVFSLNLCCHLCLAVPSDSVSLVIFVTIHFTKKLIIVLWYICSTRSWLCLDVLRKNVCFKWRVLWSSNYYYRGKRRISCPDSRIRCLTHSTVTTGADLQYGLISITDCRLRTWAKCEIASTKCGFLMVFSRVVLGVGRQALLSSVLSKLWF